MASVSDVVTISQIHANLGVLEGGVPPVCLSTVGQIRHKRALVILLRELKTPSTLGVRSDAFA